MTYEVQETARLKADIDKLMSERDGWLQEIEQLRREIRRGENTYHEGYAAGLKKAEADNERLRALLQELIDIEGPQPGTREWANKVRRELEAKP